MQMKIKVIIFTIYLTYFITTTSSNSNFLRLSNQTRRFIDSQGSQHIFHGLNVVNKGTPWLPQLYKFDPYQSFSQKDMQYLNQWGLNVIRLGMMWPGVEPSKGQYNSTYLQQMVKLVTLAGQKYGIYSILDMHQDALAARFCGEGIPQWAVEQRVPEWLDFPMPIKWPYQIPKNSTYPPRSQCGGLSWVTGQFTLSGGAGYQSLYSNYDGVGDAFNNFWVEVAKAFKDNKYIIGYQLINEPWIGDIYSAPWKIIPSIADRYTLQPFYDRAAEKIRQVDKDHIIFFESVTFDDFIPIGFEHVPGGKDFALKSSLSFHYYPLNLNVQNHFNSRMKDSERLGCGAILTEFRIDVGDVAVKTFDVADQHLMSWMGWDYKPYTSITGSCSHFFDKDSNVSEPDVKQISRTYAQVVSGKIVSMRFNDTDSTFSLSYDVSQEQVGKETKIYYNKDMRYGKGVQYEVDGDVDVSVGQKNKIVIFAKKSGRVEFSMKVKD